ncbi:MAG: AMP-binding protein [Oscillospiraceae bacterium]|nr:AMP-binding protein [Oscillospiraceae bacterium]
MKLAYSTRGWDEYSWDAHFAMARDLGFSSLELAYSEAEMRRYTTDADAARNQYELQRRLRALELTISCLSPGRQLGQPGQNAEAEQRISVCIELAAALQVPYVHIRADLALPGGGESDEELLVTSLRRLLPQAERRGVTLLLETSGVYADTSRLQSLLDRFACDRLAALWDIHHTVRYGHETPDSTIRNLGAYVKHVHVRDSVPMDGGAVRYCLTGDGDIPLKDLLLALRSIDYAGALSLVWSKDEDAADGELRDARLLLPHYVNYMNDLLGRGPAGGRLYSNRAGTGKFIWEKDTLLDLNFSQMLDRQAETFPDQLAFRYTTLDYTRTYEEFRRDVDTFARTLLVLGVRAGDKVAVWATNVPQWYIAFWATVKLGAVLVTVNTAYKIHEAEYLLRQSDTHTLIMIDRYQSSDYVAIMKELCPELETADPMQPLHCRRLPFLRHIITLDSRQPGCLTWEDALSLSGQIPVEEVWRRAALVDPDSVCNMQYTSGTTGFPKGVMLTHRNIVNNGKCIGDRMDLSTADRMMIQVPMFHCFGMVLAMTASMTHGATISPLPYFSPASSLACINQERITCFHGVPTMFIAMLQHKDFPRTDFSHMRTGIMAGSPCPISVMKDVVEKMHMTEITIVYGQTEASPGCTMSSTDDSIEVRVATVGRPLPQIECRIVDPETGEDCPDGVNGEFLARGYNLMKGYYKMPAATAAAIDAEGWLHTGDLACRTPEGNFRITGRLKDMIIRGGENIYPKEIEEFLYTHPLIQDVQVIGVPDKQYGEEIMACVIPKKGETLTEQEVKDFVKASMAKHKVPRYVAFMDAFPMNAAGKILKYKMRENAVEQLGLGEAASIETA